ncbi:hypothetical protein DUY81_09990 [Acidipropionibacterium acidipropionici]|jgi:succinate dehydrogenase hydrophobic anchor subunit|uniref:Uncharacterized protein n=1 Tax=Acidipropionibacterium acidipropionici TaxID=1748 RepID=A0AAC8YDK8_9ACTN|nr:hypothetical protein AXH35_01805 [Acidipropionibacterium acidipropionici]AOZ45893.1 hypothetical protein A8L58_03270 [Acidipropionibacterium acidipropionici]AZP38092.1 hypothetical protein DUY81_09990 [Acidipropionibacterium acidipropionici]QCV94927.1 hypothetical protein FEZ30_06305 [Acidipropionibacterium acidipropionici]
MASSSAVSPGTGHPVRGDDVKKTLTTIIAVFLVAFALYYVFTDPEGTAGVVRGFFSGIFGFIRALGG